MFRPQANDLKERERPPGDPSQPTGIITKLIASGTPPLVVGTEAFPSSQVYTVQNSLPPRFSANARWAANLAGSDVVVPQAFRLLNAT
jgi:hypothetical protein